jgi:hypothetical protein
MWLEFYDLNVDSRDSFVLRQILMFWTECKILTAMIMRSTIALDMTPFSLAEE